MVQLIHSFVEHPSDLLCDTIPTFGSSNKLVQDLSTLLRKGYFTSKLRVRVSLRLLNVVGIVGLDMTSLAAYSCDLHCIHEG